MIWFLVCSLIIFVLSLISNIIFILTTSDNAKGGAILGVIAFTALIFWDISLILNQ